MSAADDRCLHFAYGSNLASAFMRKYCPGARVVASARLPNFHIEFRHYSSNLEGGISSIIEAPGDFVRGCLYSIPWPEIEALDEIESVPEGIYRRDTFIVVGDDGAWHRAELYRVSKPAGPFKPARQYVEWMIDGARERGFDDEYIETFERFRAQANDGCP